MKLLRFVALSAIILSFSLTACEDDDDNDNAASEVSYKVLLTDKPALYDAVNIDIEQVRVHHEDEGWMDLNTNEGIYNLLALTNGEFETIAEDDLPTGLISQIRLQLGSSNTIVVNGISHELTVPSGSTSGLKLNLHQELEPGNDYQILLDFDASSSIIVTGNGNYKLKPVIHVIAEEVDGGISGQLNPEVPAQIFAIEQTDLDTTGTYTNETGGFLIQGLEAGSYNVVISPEEPYEVLTLEDVVVEEGEINELGIISL